MLSASVREIRLTYQLPTATSSERQDQDSNREEWTRRQPSADDNATDTPTTWNNTMQRQQWRTQIKLDDENESHLNDE